MMGIKDYGLMALMALLLIVGIYANYKISSHEDTISEQQEKIVSLNQSIGIHLANETTLRGSISTQNKKIDALRVVHFDKLKELEEWKRKPSKIRYETIYKTIYKEASNDCNATKDMLNAVRSIDFSSL